MASVSDILLAQGQRSAEARRRLGEIRAGGIQQLGQIASGALGQYAQHQADAPKREAEALQLQGMRDDASARTASAETETRRAAAMQDLLSRQAPIDPREILTIYADDPERGSKVAMGLQAFSDLAQKKVTDAKKNAGDLALGFKSLPEPLKAGLWPTIRQAAITGGLGDEQTIPEQPDPGFLDGVIAWSTGKGPEAPKTRQITVRNADGSESTQIVEDTPGQTFDSAAPPKPMREVVVRGPGGRPVKKLVPEEELIKGVEQYQAPVGAGSPEPLHAVLGPDGNPVLVPRSQAVGKTPASNREQGRPVTSGDAGRIAELTTSLDDVGVLRNTVIPRDDKGDVTEFGTTGTRAAIGAAVPNVLTEAFGWGEDAKKRQAVIDRVKQVIGKALEGGVLRKEDEYKYTKILPTISDVAGVVESKLRGLDDAIKLRRDRQIDALEDAGYNVSAFRARDAGGGKTGSLKVGGFTVEVEKPKGGG